LPILISAKTAEIRQIELFVVRLESVRLKRKSTVIQKGGTDKQSYVIMEMEKNWYVVHTYSGYENRLKANLEKRVETMGLQDKIFRGAVAQHEEVELKEEGKKKAVMGKIFPGYVLVELIMPDDAWYVVRNTPGVTGFIGSSGGGVKPTPLLPEEAERLLAQMGMNETLL